MFADHRIEIRRRGTALLCLVFSLLGPVASGLLAAEETYNARLIRQYIEEDKVYLLENIRQKFSRPAEKLVIEALLCEDGPKSRTLYTRQLRDYPDPELDRISTSRIEAYNLALNGTSSPHRLSQTVNAGSKVTAGTKRSAETSGSAAITGSAGNDARWKTKEGPEITTEGYTLQFGSFGSLQNAETLARKISYYSGAEIIRQENIYRVRLKKTWPTREEAADAGRQLPYDAFVVPSRQ
ncbi:MAG: SPOR domain-containing protein [Chlorobiaceae bacterium]|nr:SPOR domain-containing protein [Chlorobiaceae bacterium]